MASGLMTTGTAAIALILSAISCTTPDASDASEASNVERQGQDATRLNIEQVFDPDVASEVAGIDDRLRADLAWAA